MNSYLKVEKPDINGDCTASGHEKQIEVFGWSGSFSQPGSPTRASAGGGTVELALHQPLSLSKYSDSATSELMKACWAGKTLGKATLTCYRPSGDANDKHVECLKVEMEDVVITNYSISGGDGNLPVESLAFDYGTVQYTYVLQKPDGTAGGNKPAKADLMKRVIS